jgi:hypothetical protein
MGSIKLNKRVISEPYKGPGYPSAYSNNTHASSNDINESIENMAFS